MLKTFGVNLRKDTPFSCRAQCIHQLSSDASSDGWLRYRGKLDRQVLEMRSQIGSFCLLYTLVYQHPKLTTPRNAYAGRVPQCNLRSVIWRTLVRCTIDVSYRI